MYFLTLDFETYYDRFYSLKKMTPAEYILHPKFETICVSVKIDDGPTEVIDGPDFPAWLENHSPSECILLTYNSLFDNCILAWRYGWVPARMIDGLGMARYCYGHLMPKLSLEKLAEHLKIGRKSEELKTMLGVSRAKLMEDPVHKAKFWEYCANDTELLYSAYKIMAKEFPLSEYPVMDLVLRVAVCPVFKPNIALLQQHHKQVIAAKEELIAASGIDRDTLSSSGDFVDLLTSLGVNIEYKVSNTGNLIPAVAKTDDFMKELTEHSDPLIQAIAAARIGVKSTLEEKRCERLISISSLPWSPRPFMPIPLRYAGAHTNRLSGEWKINMQNLPSGRGGRSTALRESLEAPEGCSVIVADLGQIEARLTAWLSHSPMLGVFASGEDVYRWMASKIFHIPIEQVTDDQRAVGKAAVLGLGFGLGPANFYTKTIMSARANNQDITGYFTQELATTTVEEYRLVNRDTKNLWYLLDNILRNEWMGLAAPRILGPVEIGHGYVKGPGGLMMHYDVPFGPGKLAFPSQHGDLFYNYGKRRKKIYGAAFLENIIQFLARILLFNAAVRISKQGYLFANTSHDELGYIVRNEDVDKVKKLVHMELTTPPSWASDLPLKASVGVGKSYGEAK